MTRGTLITLIGLGLSMARAAPAQDFTLDLNTGRSMDFVWIEPGTFVMGTTEEQATYLRSVFLGDPDRPTLHDSELPAHPVTLTRGFYIGSTEVTRTQWRAVMQTEPWPTLAAPGGDLTPATGMTWFEARMFTERLVALDPDGAEYRLPTEAEWEYAARAGTQTLWSYGDDRNLRGEYGCVLYDGGGFLCAVGSHLPNPWGLFGMHGNVFEWTLGQWTPYTADPEWDPRGPLPESDADWVVTRGGGWGHAGMNVDMLLFASRSAWRENFQAGRGFTTLGLRVVRIGHEPTAVGTQSWGYVKTPDASR